jgi:hypothetical protein
MKQLRDKEGMREKAEPQCRAEADNAIAGL